MKEILRYTLFDLLRSRWAIAYTGFFLLSGFTLLLLNNDVNSAIISLMSISLVLVPLISVIFGVIYYYNTREYIELLLAQPIDRRSVFMGLYLGICLALCTCLFVGLSLPFLLMGAFGGGYAGILLSLIAVNLLLTAIFSAVAFFFIVGQTDKVKGFGLMIFIWLFFAVIYDGIFLFLLSVFRDYPLENAALIGSLFNPISLSRILMMMQLDISALLGLTGAVFNRFFGQNLGMVTALVLLVSWWLVPLVAVLRRIRRLDF